MELFSLVIKRDCGQDALTYSLVDILVATHFWFFDPGDVLPQNFKRSSQVNWILLKDRITLTHRIWSKILNYECCSRIQSFIGYKADRAVLFGVRNFTLNSCMGFRDFILTITTNFNRRFWYFGTIYSLVLSIDFISIDLIERWFQWFAPNKFKTNIAVRTNV